jgi:8-oxo-dGTP diphosphatase
MERRTEIVVAAMIVREDGRILIAERPEGKFMAGWWECPGGKLEFAEPPEAGLQREVREELAIEIEVGDPFHAVHVSRTPDSAVFVVFYFCRWVSGAIELLDAGATAWVRPDELPRMRFLESNRPVVEKLISTQYRARPRASSREFTFATAPAAG